MQNNGKAVQDLLPTGTRGGDNEPTLPGGTPLTKVLSPL